MYQKEKYPDYWKLACLEFLRIERERIRQLTGYKRVGWLPVRNAIMEPYDTTINGAITISSDLLNESTLEAWDRRDDSSISDGKFKFVDQYIRRLAILGQSKYAVDMLERSRLTELLSAYRTIYRKSDIDSSLSWRNEIPDWTKELMIGELPNECHVVIKSIGSLGRDVYVIFTIFPQDFDLDDVNNTKGVMFFNGFLIASEKEFLIEDVDRNRASLFHLKLKRQEFEGLSHMGYADGQVFHQSAEFDFGRTETHTMIVPPPSILLPGQVFARDSSAPMDYSEPEQGSEEYLEILRKNKILKELQFFNVELATISKSQDLYNSIDNYIMYNYSGYLI